MPGKHNIELDISPEAQEYIRDWVFRSVRSKVLQKLLLIWFLLWMLGNRSSLHRKVKKRLLKKYDPYLRKDDYATEISLEEIMEIIHCSKRTAIEYQDALVALQGGLKPTFRKRSL